MKIVKIYKNVGREMRIYWYFFLVIFYFKDG